jgi:hypothetical protein
MLYCIKKITALMGFTALSIFTQAHAGSYMNCTDKEGNNFAHEFEVMSTVIPDKYKQAVLFEPTREAKGSIYLYGTLPNLAAILCFGLVMAPALKSNLAVMLRTFVTI